MVRRCVEQKELQIQRMREQLPLLVARKEEIAKALGEPGAPGPLREVLEDKLARKGTVEKMLRTQIAQVKQVQQELALRKAQNAEVEKTCVGVASEIERARGELERLRLAYSAEAFTLGDNLRSFSEPEQVPAEAAQAFEKIAKVVKFVQALTTFPLESR